MENRRLFDFINNTSDVIVELNSGNDSPDSLVLFGDNHMEGNIGGKSYWVGFQPQYRVLEVYCNDSLFAVIRDLNNYRVVYATPAAGPELTGDMLDLVCAYDHALRAVSEMESKQDNDD